MKLLILGDRALKDRVRRHFLGPLLPSTRLHVRSSEEYLRTDNRVCCSVASKRLSLHWLYPMLVSHILLRAVANWQMLRAQLVIDSGTHRISINEPLVPVVYTVWDRTHHRLPQNEMAIQDRGPTNSWARTR